MPARKSRSLTRRRFLQASNGIVQRALGAGLVIRGKTNTPEFGLVPTTESLLLGPAHNPWNPERTTGGSSGGAAAAVASGMLPFAQGYRQMRPRRP